MRAHRSFILSIAFALATASGATAAEAVDDVALANLSWIAGHWTAIDDDGRYSEEIWTLPRGGMLLGLHRDVTKTRTSFEFMRIAKTDEGIVYFAQPSGRDATPFRLVEATPNRAVFANPDHDFPQRIIYTREDDRLCALVEGGSDKALQWCWTRRAE